MFEPIYAAWNLILPPEAVGALFLQRALTGGLFLALACGVLGVNVLGHRLSYFSNAVSHSSFAGVALGLVLGLDPTYTLTAFAVVTGLVLAALRRRGRLAEDTGVGVVFAAVMAVGVALVSAVQGLGRDLSTYIYGDILALGEGEVGLALATLVVTVIFSLLTYNRLALIAVNRETAQAAGVPVRRLEYLQAALVAVVVGVAVRAVGILFVTALLILPAATARNLARRDGSLLWLSVGAATLATIGGLLASIRLNTSSGATIILAGALIFVLSLSRRLFRCRPVTIIEKKA